MAKTKDTYYSIDYARQTSDAIAKNMMNNGMGYDASRNAINNYISTYNNGKYKNTSDWKNGDYQVKDNGAGGASPYNNGKGTGTYDYYELMRKNPSNFYNRYGLTNPNTKNGSSYLSGIGSFKASEAYNQAMAYTNSLLEQLNSGRTAYSDKVDELMNTINGRDKFSYNMDTDPMFQQYLESSMAKGKIAMQDTIGQASALTGGYGSTYATAAANSAYNDYVSNAYDNVADYYNMALNAYNQEGQDLYNQLGMYQTADQTAYARLSDAYSANLANAQNIYNQEYSNYWDTANYNYNVQKYNADVANQEKQNAYNTYLNYLNKQDTADSSKNSKTSQTETTYKKASATEYSKALSAYEQYGDSGLDKYVASLDDNTDVEDLYNYVTTYAYNGVKNQGWTNSKDTKNWFGGLDNNDKVTNGNGQTYTLKQFVQYLMSQGMSEEQATAYAKQFNGNK